MKRLACCLLVLIAFSFAAPLAAAPDRFEKQGATLWVKEEMTRLKKTLALLRRVKDEKSAEKVAKVLLEMYGRVGERTAMGEVGAAEVPKGEAAEAAFARNAPRIQALEEAIAEQCTRIEALELTSEDFASALKSVKLAPSISDADFSVPEEEKEEEEPSEKPERPGRPEKP